MATKIRLARGGSKKRPHYAIVLSDSRMRRDGRFLEKLGVYDPMLAKDDEKRVVMNLDRIKELLATGAQPTDRVARFLEVAGVLPKKVRNNPKSAVPGKAMTERAKKKADKAAEPAPEPVAVEAAVEAIVEAPAAEAPAAEVAADETKAE
jgi:small subunit ribosomal protein S16